MIQQALRALRGQLSLPQNKSL